MAKRPVDPLLPHPDAPGFEAAVAEMVERRWGAFRVLGHSGRGRGEPWRVLFESADRAEAERFFWRRVAKEPKSGLSRKATMLEQTGVTTIHSVEIAGEDGADRSRVDETTAIAASKARWEREQRAAQQRRARVEVPRLRIEPVREAGHFRVSLSDDLDAAEHEAAAEEEAAPRRGRGART